MKSEKPVTIDEKYLEAIEYLQAHDTVRVILFRIDITNFKSMKNEDIARRRKGHKIWQ